MRKLLYAIPLLAAMWAVPAQAQFGNTSLGLGVGYLRMTNSIEWGVPISFEGSRYIENGFETYIHTGLMILTEPVLKRQVIGVTPAVGVRYLFSEESIRPYIGADLAYIHIFFENAAYQRVGPGLNLGVDAFVSDSITIGVRGTAALYISLNVSPEFSFGLLGVASTYF